LPLVASKTTCKSKEGEEGASQERQKHNFKNTILKLQITNPCKTKTKKDQN
jgi:hypothetical protein